MASGWLPGRHHARNGRPSGRTTQTTMCHSAPDVPQYTFSHNKYKMWNGMVGGQPTRRSRHIFIRDDKLILKWQQNTTSKCITETRKAQDVFELRLKHKIHRKYLLIHANSDGFIFGYFELSRLPQIQVTAEHFLPVRCHLRQEIFLLLNAAR